jgi:hypothetical protein
VDDQSLDNFKEKGMKKIVSLIGVSVMVLALGLGSGLAQQTAPKETPPVPAAAQEKQAAPADVVKEKMPLAKPGVEVKPDKGAPVASPAVKTPEKAALESKTGTVATAGKEMEKAATPKMQTEVKPLKAAAQPGSMSQPTDKAAVAKSAVETKSEKPNVGKEIVDKNPVKSDDVKTPIKQ